MPSVVISCSRLPVLNFRYLSGFAQKRSWSDDVYYRSTEYRERSTSVTSFYNQSAIDKIAAKVLTLPFFNTVVSNHVNSDHAPAFSCLDV